MSLIRDTSSCENNRFHCTKCKLSQSIRNGSFFEDSKLTIPEILSIICILLGSKSCHKKCRTLTGVAEQSVSQWHQYIREKCSESLTTSSNYTFGGVGVVIQIDKSVVAKRKYNMGHYVEQQCVFGLYDMATKLGHIQLVDDRRVEMLIPIIQKYALPGTTIFSDQWPAY